MPDPMKLTAPTRLIIEVDPSTFLHAPQSRASLWYHFERLFSGQEVAVQEMESWGLKVQQPDPPRETIPSEVWLKTPSVGY
mgnify:CR=1 FL=1